MTGEPGNRVMAKNTDTALAARKRMSKIRARPLRPCMNRTPDREGGRYDLHAHEGDDR